MVFFASFLVQRRPVLSLVTHRIGPLELPRVRDLGPVLIAWFASMLVLVRESDLGSALLFFGMFVVMLYIATERVSWLLIGVVLFAAGSYVAYQAFPHVQERVEIWLHAFNGTNPTDSSYQLVQGLFGFATGGVLGTGLGRGEPQIVPVARTDFIFASLGEELGLVGVMAILVIYLVITSRGLRAAVGVRDSFGKLLAAGLSVSFALQVFVVVGGVMRVIPLTGLTLPFLSYGGSSVVANFVLIALLIRISDAGRQPATWPVADPGRREVDAAGGAGMNRPIRKVVLFCALIFAVLLVNATVVQVGEAHSLNSNVHNGRVLIDSYERQRGDIIVNGAPGRGVSTATTDALKYLRKYPAGTLYADVTGYYSLLADTGVERSQNGILSGSDSRISLSISRIGQLLSGATPQGGNVTLTPRRQGAAAGGQAAGRPPGSRRRPRPPDGGDPRDGHLADVRPEPADLARRDQGPGRIRRAHQAERLAAAQPGDAADLSAGARRSS